jgi:hypothetical protein
MPYIVLSSILCYKLCHICTFIVMSMSLKDTFTLMSMSWKDVQELIDSLAVHRYAMDGPTFLRSKSNYWCTQYMMPYIALPPIPQYQQSSHHGCPFLGS